MAEISRRPPPAWVPWAIAAAVLVVLGLLWIGWQNANRGALDADIVARPTLPDLPPRLPDAPRIPDAPVPRPK